METKSQPKLLYERFQMAHRLETPQPLAQSLRESAKKIGQEKPEELISNLVTFKQNIFDFMNHFNLELKDFESDMEDKRFREGGFTKRAIQDHPQNGVNELRLVRDKVSSRYLEISEDSPYKDLLNRKLQEKTKNLAEAMSRKERKEELVDIFEVFSTILNVNNIKASVIESNRQKREIEMRREKKRKFSKKK